MKARIRAWAEKHRPKLIGIMIGSWVGFFAACLAIWSMRGCQ